MVDGNGQRENAVSQRSAAELLRHHQARIPILGPASDDGLLVDLLAQIAPQASVHERPLVENPRSFSGFD